MFWDSSALIPLLVVQPTSAHKGIDQDNRRVVWWGTRIECSSAMCRLRREGVLTGDAFTQLLIDLDALLDQAIEVQPIDAVRERAERLLKVHPLRAADALQLGAALVYCEERPKGEGFACLDVRLREAARAEGFRIYPDTIP